MLKKILDELDVMKEDDSGLNSLDEGIGGYNKALDDIKNFLITAHIQQLEEEIQELDVLFDEPLTTITDDFKDMSFKSGFMHAIHILKHRRQQQLKDAKELLGNR